MGGSEKVIGGRDFSKRFGVFLNGVVWQISAALWRLPLYGDRLSLSLNTLILHLLL